jgi:hypothetical protein
VNVLFGGLPTKRSQKATRWEGLNIEPEVPTPLRWSEVPARINGQASLNQGGFFSSRSW